jgi:glycosyltransferase involved in cell wall biosynthesis
VRERCGLPAAGALVLFFGQLSHRPNRQAVERIVHEVAPRLQALPILFVIAGRGGHAYATTLSDPVDNVRFLDHVDDLVPLIKSAACTIAPLQSGGGTRFKIIESAACGTPVVSTSIGAEGLDHALFGDALIICDEWEQFAAHIAWLCTDVRRWSPTEAFRSVYDWQHILSRLVLPEGGP